MAGKTFKLGELASPAVPQVGCIAAAGYGL